LDLDPLPFPGQCCVLNRFEPFVLSFFAFLASLWWVLEALVAKEALLANGPDKQLPTIDTKDLDVF